MPLHTTHPAGNFCWIDMATTDPVHAKRFYMALFGWTFVDSPMGPDAMYTQFSSAGHVVSAIYPMMPENRVLEMKPTWHVYVAVTNVDESAARATALGGMILMEPHDVLDVGRMCFVQDPTGGMFVLWQAKSHPGFAMTGEPGSACWFQLLTPDIDRAVAFYTALFGWKIEVQQMPGGAYHLISNNGVQIGGMQQILPEMGPLSPEWMVFYATASTPATVAHANELGGAVLSPPVKIPEVGVYALVADPQGGRFALLDGDK